MKAVRIHGYGGQEVVRYEDAPVPVPAPHEVRVRVHATSVKPVGHVRPVIAAELPLEEVNRAFALSEAGHVRGKVVLRVAPR